MNRGDDDGFLSRWSRRKADARRPGGPAPADPGAGPERVPGPGATSAAQPAASTATAPQADGSGLAGAARPAAASPSGLRADGQAPMPASPPETAPTLDDVASLTPDADFTRFVRRDVDPGVRNAALKKLFADPHYNVMDGLDIYIDDYGKPDPLPPGMLRQMVQAESLGLFRSTDDPAPDDAPPRPAGGTPDAPPAGAPTTPQALPPAAAPADPGTASAAAPRDGAASPAEPSDAPAARSASPAFVPADPSRDVRRPAAVLPTALHEDPDLRLQPDDAAGRGSAVPGPGQDPRRQR